MKSSLKKWLKTIVYTLRNVAGTVIKNNSIFLPWCQFVLRSRMVRGWFVNGFWVIGSGSRGVVWGRGIWGVVGGVIGHGHCHGASQQHFAQHDVHSREDKSDVNENYRDPEILYKQL